MNKVETANKNDQLTNIKSLPDFETGKVIPFIAEYEKLKKEITELTDSIREKRAVILAKAEEQQAREYEKAMKELAKADKKAEESAQQEAAPDISTVLPETEEPAAPKAIEEVKPVAEVKPAEKEPVKTVQAAPAPAQPAVPPLTSAPQKSNLDNIPELKMKSRPKPVKEEPSQKGRVYIPDNSTKPSGQPINRYTDGMPRSRRPQEGEIRSGFNRAPAGAPGQGPRPYPPRQGGDFRPGPRGPHNGPFKPASNLKNAIETAPAFSPKENRTAVKKKVETKPGGEEVKKTMDKRTLIRRGFMANVTPGAALDFDADDRHFKAKRGKREDEKPQAIVIEKAVITSEMVPIKVLSEKIGKTGAQIIKQLFILGIVKTINEAVDFQTAELVAGELGVQLELNAAKSSEELLASQFDGKSEEKIILKHRPPVVTIMGHVDHGKTSLLDYIRKTKVAAGEAGGITQHIGAYTVDINKQKITFLDTPGHEAFTSMRLRGAQATDIAVIVIAADDGIMPQTIEAISHAKASNVSIVVAMNKMDKRNANPERIKQQLTEQGLVPEEWGGDIICVPVSATTGEGVDKLLETILLVAEVKELKADYDHYAKGVIIEAELDKGKGPVATVLVQSGTLKVSDYIVAGLVTGKIRAMIDDKGLNIKSATPSMPVQIQGFEDVPQAGDIIMAVAEERLAKKVVEDRNNAVKSTMTASKAGTSLEDVFNQMAEGSLKELNIIIKGDVQGSVEAIKQELTKLGNEEVKVNIVQANVGAVNESDVMLAESSHSIIVAFNVRPDSKAKKMSERSNIDIRVYRIIYDIINDIQLALKGMLAPKMQETVLGRAEVRMTFKVSGAGTIAGSYVLDGKILRNAKARLLRNNVIVAESSIGSLKRLKDDAKEVAQGFECGIGLENYNDIKEHDIIEVYTVEEITA